MFKKQEELSEIEQKKSNFEEEEEEEKEPIDIEIVTGDQQLPH